ncbi:MAG: hypothetical protein A2Y82_01935 [Candidatus Buchananbacteria bacterium RBG_13_36_9]|uniref:HAMP domain-containing protein n=1 Tax=Candidatus Buchananbacteria bacterium RBG_13_36_9 TaxID=1797530 RepID=A0A1G1XM24_9BACT|nr:MAG: hypothetical protein A2Y82_01935 [Candidatus Buchananbacteria bacterium RBG_13_36_9]
MAIKISLKYKLIIFIYLILLIPFFASIFYIWRQTDQGLSQIEKNWINDILASENKLQDKYNNLLLKNVLDYSTWDEIYDNASSKDPAWFKKNVTDWVPNNYNVDWILAVDGQNNLISQYNPPSEYSANFNKTSFIQKALAGESSSGFLFTSHGLFRIAYAPILRTGGIGPINGVLMYGQLINPISLLEIKNIIKGDINFILPNQTVISTNDQSAEYKNALLEQIPDIKNNLEQNNIITAVKGNLLYLFTPLLDIESKPIGTLALTLELTNFIQIRKQLIYVFFAVIFLSFILVLLAVPFFIKTIANPLRQLISAMEFKEDNLPAKVMIKTGDELEQVADNFNRMVDKLKTSRQEIDLKNQELKLKVTEMEKFNKLSIDRELKMIELKNEITELKK